MNNVEVRYFLFPRYNSRMRLVGAYIQLSILSNGTVAHEEMVRVYGSMRRNLISTVDPLAVFPSLWQAEEYYRKLKGETK